MALGMIFVAVQHNVFVLVTMRCHNNVEVVTTQARLFNSTDPVSLYLSDRRVRFIFLIKSVKPSTLGHVNPRFVSFLIFNSTFNS